MGQWKLTVVSTLQVACASDDFWAPTLCWCRTSRTQLASFSTCLTCHDKRGPARILCDCRATKNARREHVGGQWKSCGTFVRPTARPTVRRCVRSTIHRSSKRPTSEVRPSLNKVQIKFKRGLNQTQTKFRSMLNQIWTMIRQCLDSIYTCARHAVNMCLHM